LALLAFGLLARRNYQHKQTLQRQRIAELEKEKQLNAAEAVLKGEEQERRRLAKDLHDGLGGMLSGIKFSLQHMQTELPSDAQPAIHRSLDMLDSSISEMRRVAHNMMPEVLMRFGLDKALQDYCHSIKEHGQLQLVYQSSGLGQMAKDTSIEITVYRIVQELVNNIVKHANAQNALVQVTFFEDKLTVTVEDDGIGFDPKKNKENGIGWTNILSRVAFLNGQLDVKSSEGEGTSVLVELPALSGATG
jgi:signal transduction histidine kinase